MTKMADFQTACDAQNLDYLDFRPQEGKILFSCGVDFYVFNYISKAIVGNQRASASITSLSVIEESKYFVVASASKIFFYDSTQVAVAPTMVQNELKKEYIANGASSLRYSSLDGVILYASQPLSQELKSLYATALPPDPPVDFNLCSDACSSSCSVAWSSTNCTACQATHVAVPVQGSSQSRCELINSPGFTEYANFAEANFKGTPIFIPSNTTQSSDEPISRAISIGVLILIGLVILIALAYFIKICLSSSAKQTAYHPGVQKQYQNQYQQQGQNFYN